MEWWRPEGVKGAIREREVLVHEKEEIDQIEGGLQRPEAEGREGWARKVGERR